jgi:hypothetical protein
MSSLTVPALELSQIQFLHRFMHEKTQVRFPNASRTFGGNKYPCSALYS